MRSQYFSQVSDFRVVNRCLHKLEDILFIGLCTIICHGEDFEDMVSFGEERINWLKQYIELPNGIPSHDTFNRVLQYIDPKELIASLTKDGEALINLIEENHIGFDGKKIKGVSPKSRGNTGLYIVSAWVNEQRLCIGQEKVEDKSNEITAIPKLLDQIDISHSTVTIDAIGCQKEIASKIIEKGGHYILSVKLNQSDLYHEIEDSFKYLGGKKSNESIPNNQDEVQSGQYNETWEYDHGRYEKRQCRILKAKDVIYEELLSKWEGLSTLIEISSERIVNDTIYTETRYYIGSRNNKFADYFNAATRGHWSIENRLHWHLDVTFGEDRSRARKGNAPENLNIFRKMALHRVSQMKDKKSINKRRYKAALNEKYLEKIIFGSKLNF